MQALAGAAPRNLALSLGDFHKIFGVPLYDDPLQRYASARLDGTCEWIFRKDWYQNWCSHTVGDASKFLWLYGSPGTGKTIICATIILELQQSSDLVLHYFSSAHSQSQNDLTIIIRHWVSEIVREIQDGWILVQCILREMGIGAFVSSSDVWTIFGKLVSMLRNCVFVLDGFDEYKKATRYKFLSRLKDYLKGSSSRVLITSRDEADIRSELTPTNTDTSELEFNAYQISKVDTQADIQMLSTKTIDSKLPKQDETSRSQLASTLVDRCDGMFLWITLTAKQLSEGRSPAALRRTVNKVPAELHSLYEHKWNEILQEPDTEERARAIAILTWCTYCLDPLTVEQISEVLVVQPYDMVMDLDEDELPTVDKHFVTDIMRLCSSFIDLRSTSSDERLAKRTLHLIHGSTKDFLSTKLPLLHSDTVSTKHPLNQNTPHLMLSKICLRYLCYENVNESVVRLDESRWTFCRYAKFFWLNHQRISQIFDEECDNLIVRFLNVQNPNFLSWSANFDAVAEKELTDLSFNFHPAAPLYYASSMNFAPVVETILRIQSPDIDAIGGRDGTALQATCIKGNEACFELLMASKADVNVEAGIFGTALIAAANMGHLHQVQELLLHNANINMKSFLGDNPILGAAAFGHLEIVKVLISHGADIETLSSVGWTPLMLAASKDHTAIGRILLQHGASCAYQDKLGTNALDVAAGFGGKEFVQLLLDYGADISAVTNYGFNALSFAASAGFSKVVELLLDRGASFDTDGPTKAKSVKASVDHESAHSESLKMVSPCDQVDVTKHLSSDDSVGAMPRLEFTALLVASANGQEEIVKLLIKRGADVGSTDLKGNTPLHAASYFNRPGIVRCLMEHGADPAKLNSEHVLPIHLAAVSGNEDIVKFLLAQNTDPDLLDNPEIRLLECAVSGGHRTVELVLEQGFDLDAPYKQGRTPLSRAVWLSKVPMVKLLLEHGAHPNVGVLRDASPLYIASQLGNLEILRLLLEKGAGVTAVDDYGQTPLYVAAANGHTKIVEALLSANSDPYSIDCHNTFPLHMAACHAHMGIVELLLTGDITAKAYNQSILDNKKCANKDVSIITDGILILHAAAGSGSLKIFDYCLDMGFSSSEQDSHGKTVLEYACISGSRELIERILKLNDYKDSRTQSSYPWSLLHLVCRKGSFDTLKLLSEAGVDPSSVETTLPLAHWTPLDIARYYSNTNLINQDGAILEDLPWSSITQSGLIRTNDETGMLEGVFENSLAPLFKSFPEYCSGCLSVSQIIKSR